MIVESGIASDGIEIYVKPQDATEIETELNDKNANETLDDKSAVNSEEIVLTESTLEENVFYINATAAHLNSDAGH